MNQNPWLVACMILLGFALVWFWVRDFRAGHGEGHPRPLPGATRCRYGIIWLGAVCGLVVVSAETTGEALLGIAHAQTTVTPVYAVWTIVAALVEEIIFRGYLVVDGRGKAALWGSVVTFSALFAALHPFLWNWGPNGLEWMPGIKGWFSTGFAFAGSLVFYVLRFNAWNPRRSLLPSFAAHVAKNAGVIVIKALMGFVA